MKPLHCLFKGMAFLVGLTAASPAWATNTSSTVTTSSPTFTVPSDPLGGLNGCGIMTGVHYYETQTFMPQSTGITTMDTTALSGFVRAGQNDNFLAFYSGVFDPQNPTNNLVACNDDGHLPRWAKIVTGSPLVSGQVYTVVYTAFDAISAGPVNTTGTGSYSILPDVTLGYTVGGTLPGLSAGKTIVLQQNGGDNLTLSAAGSFVFNAVYADTTAYDVTILTQPAGQTCTVNSGSGTISAGNVNSVVVNCPADVGGTLSGLGASNSIVLRNNGGNALTLNANGTFRFSTPLAIGATYAVTVGTPPNGQTCNVTGGSGTVAGNVTSVAVSCSGGQPIPTLNEWGMMVFGALLLGTMVYSSRKKQPPTPA